MDIKKEIEGQALIQLTFLKEYGFQEPSIRQGNYKTVISYLAEDIGIEVELEWFDKSVFVLIVRLESGQLPKGYYVSEADGKVCRVHLQIALYDLGYRDERINAESFFRKHPKRKFKDRSVEGMKSILDLDSHLLKQTIELIVSNKESVFTKGSI